jgi:hypothetical protein
MARIKEVEVSIGMSVEVKGVWVKPVVGLKIEMDVDDSEPSTRAAVMERAFEVAEIELDKEINRLELGGERDKAKEDRSDRRGPKDINPE